MKILYSFRETKSFTKRLVNLVSDEEFANFQRLLLQVPESGDRIPGGGGIRKIRFPAKGKGKRGGARVIYYFAVSKEEICLLDIYAKNEKVNLNLPELNSLRKIVGQWLSE